MKITTSAPIRVLALAAITAAGLSVAGCDRSGDAGTVQAEAPAPAWVQKEVVLYLPSKVMEQRVKIDDLSPYMTKVAAEAAGVFEAQDVQPGATGAVLVMVKPGGQHRAWVVTGEPALKPEIISAVVERVQAITPPPVTGGPIMVGVQFESWGGGADPAGAKPPIPREWYDYFSKDGGLLDDAFMARVWPD